MRPSSLAGSGRSRLRARSQRPVAQVSVAGASPRSPRGPPPGSPCSAGRGTGRSARRRGCGSAHRRPRRRMGVGAVDEQPPGSSASASRTGVSTRSASDVPPRSPSRAMSNATRTLAGRPPPAGRAPPGSAAGGRRRRGRAWRRPTCGRRCRRAGSCRAARGRSRPENAEGVTSSGIGSGHLGRLRVFWNRLQVSATDYDPRPRRVKRPQRHSAVGCNRFCKPRAQRGSATMATTRILQLSDLHAFADPDGRLFGIPTRELPQDVLAHVQETGVRRPRRRDRRPHPRRATRDLRRGAGAPRAIPRPPLAAPRQPRRPRAAFRTPRPDPRRRR